MRAKRKMWGKIKVFPQKHPLALSLLLGVVGNLVWSIIQIGLNKVNFFEAFWQVPNAVFSFVVYLLTLNVPVWSVLLVIAVVILLFWFYVKITDKPQKNEPPYKDYLTDFYKGQKYRWRYYDNVIERLRPVCNECDGELAPDSLSGYNLICPNCDKQYRKPDVAELNLAMTYFINKANKKLKSPSK